MKRYAIVSYNIYCNFTNYGSALQTYALHHAIDTLDPQSVQSIVLDYCPDILRDKDPLNPFANMWDKDEEARKLCEMTMPAIRINNDKFNNFYKQQYRLSSQKYISENFNECEAIEKLDGFVCGSDTVFCIDEFGFDDGYYANFPVMKNGYSISYAASFGDSHFDADSYATLNERLQNFNAISLRENDMIGYVSEHTNAPVEKVIDPTLLLTAADYDKVAGERQYNEKYILMYARRYNAAMEAYAMRLAKENGWKLVEISLRATNAEKGHEMRYDAGVEEFLSLVKHAEMVVTNSFHGLIFAVQYSRPFYVFSREAANTKIAELLDMFGIHDRLLINGNETKAEPIDYEQVHKRIGKERAVSLAYLKKYLTNIK